MRVHRYAMWLSLFLFAACGLLVLDETQRLQGREQLGAALFMPLEIAVSHAADDVGEVAGTVQDIGRLRAENRALRDENAQLRAQLPQAQRIAQENERLRSLLSFRDTHESHQYLPARVVARGSNTLLPMLTIDAGSSLGVRPGMPVVAPGGLVGRVTKVADRWANVLPLDNPTSAVAAAVDGTTSPATGVLQGAPGKATVLSFVPSTEHLHVGAWVLTSGIGSAFPANLPIGIIVAVQKQDVALFQSATVQPAAALDQLTDVLIVTDYVPLDVSP